MALPLLRAASVSADALHASIARLREELVTVMFCAGARTIEELRAANLRLVPNNPVSPE
jgi:isopentenyl diphosphate isomerase/L-lactate dehydrogenase-like FMN-dependent dehydrogenase